ncbi:MAG: hypothetical protein HY695_32170 [Deltaproteobacteria bacterium]|nr:hypothetical protein [Deltaproteobacteria bacterium]
MDFDGSMVIDSPPEKVWRFLWDVERLARCIPACQGVQAIKEREKYQLALSDSVGPIRVSFDAYADVKVLEPGKSIRVFMEGKDLKAGGMRQTMDITLEGLGESKTKLDFKTSVAVFGKLGTLGYPFIKKKANSMIEEFGQRVKTEIESG